MNALAEAADALGDTRQAALAAWRTARASGDAAAVEAAAAEVRRQVALLEAHLDTVEAASDARWAARRA